MTAVGRDVTILGALPGTGILDTPEDTDSNAFSC